MYEYEKIIKRYFSKERNIHLYGEVDEKYLHKVILAMKKFEAPDIVSVLENKVVAIEHFEFDSYINTKKGSNLKIQENKINKEFDEYVMSNIRNSKSILKRDSIMNNSSLDSYFKNF